MTTIEDLKGWFERGKQMGAAYMLSVCDTYDWEDYPCYVMPNEDLDQKAREHNGPNMTKLMEVYNLSKPFDRQKMIGRFAFDGWPVNNK